MILKSTLEAFCTLHIRELSLGALIGTEVLLCRMHEVLARHAAVQLCNERLLVHQLTVQLWWEQVQQNERQPVQPMDGPSAYIADLPHIGVTWLLPHSARDAANCYAPDPPTRVA